MVFCLLTLIQALNIQGKNFEVALSVFLYHTIKFYYCRQESKHSIFSPHCGIQCSIPSKVCPLRKRLPLSCHKNSSQIFDATKLWKHTIPLTYNTKTLISNISETHHFSPQMRLIAYPDHKTTHKVVNLNNSECWNPRSALIYFCALKWKWIK